MIKKKNVVERYNLPLEVKFCKRCTTSNQRPRIGFDEEGVCSACRFAEYKNTRIDWDEREGELVELCNKYRRNDGTHDVIVPSSGGKDSTFIAHQLKYKYGMNPLTVTWAPHLYTEIGFRNLQSLIHVGGVDNVLFTPDGITHRKLTKLSFEVLGDPFQPFIYGQIHVPLQVSITNKIPLVMYGENPEAEYGGNMKNAFSPTRDYKGDIKDFALSGLSPEDLIAYGVQVKEIHPYLKPSAEELDKNKTEIHMLGYYKKWNSRDNYYYALDATGYSASPVRNEGTYSRYASLDDKLDGFHYYLAFIKFGIGRATQDSANEIRGGQLSREEGVEMVRKYDGEFPLKYFKEFLEYCDISDDFFWEVIDSWRSPHLWEKTGGEWKLKQQIFSDLIYEH